MRDRTGLPSYRELGLTLVLWRQRIQLAVILTGLSVTAIGVRAGLRSRLKVGEVPPTSYMDRVCNFLGVDREQFCGPLPHFMAGLDAAKASGWHDTFVAPKPAGLKWKKHPRFGTVCHPSDEPGEAWPMHFPIHARW